MFELYCLIIVLQSVQWNLYYQGHFGAGRLVLYNRLSPFWRFEMYCENLKCTHLNLSFIIMEVSIVSIIQCVHSTL